MTRRHASTSGLTGRSPGTTDLLDSLRRKLFARRGAARRLRRREPVPGNLCLCLVSTEPAALDEALSSGGAGPEVAERLTGALPPEDAILSDSLPGCRSSLPPPAENSPLARSLHARVLGSGAPALWISVGKVDRPDPRVVPVIDPRPIPHLRHDVIETALTRHQPLVGWHRGISACEPVELPVRQHRHRRTASGRYNARR